ncbi:MAG TPA: aldehyde dehydrogenase family protein [Exilispira sp.]|nr:aldehyde dehydrogenase family protein [Exilispira sp.]
MIAEIKKNLFCEIPIEQRETLIDGKLFEFNEEKIEIYSPIYENNRPIYLGSHPRMTSNQALLALEAAAKAFDNGNGLWPTMKVEDRIKAVEKFLTSMKKFEKEIVSLLMLEIAKSKMDSEKEFTRTISYIEDTIFALKDLDRTSSRLVIADNVYAQIRRSPLGIVLCMGPFNYPLNETFTTLIPALIMGNTVIVKPPKIGVLFFKYLLPCFAEAFPPGVVNFVYGDGPTIITPIISSGRVDVLAFIGTSKVADIIRKQHPAPHRLRCVLGLDAKNPAIVLDDADLNLTVSEIISGSLSFNGQRCTALKIIFIDRKIEKSFKQAFFEKIKEIKIGLPWEDSFITPVAEKTKPYQLYKLVEDALSKGANAFIDGDQIELKDLSKFLPTKESDISTQLVKPIVLWNVKENMDIYNVEQFGPLIPIVIFDSIDFPLSYIVNSNYGQQASIFSNDPQKIAKLIDPLVNQVSRVNINSQCQRGPDIFPFTGRKDSAEGTLSITDALRVFSIRSLVAFKGTQQNKEIVDKILDQRLSNFLNTDFIL